MDWWILLFPLYAAPAYILGFSEPGDSKPDWVDVLWVACWPVLILLAGVAFAVDRVASMREGANGEQ